MVQVAAQGVDTFDQKLELLHLERERANLAANLGPGEDIEIKLRRAQRDVAKFQGEVSLVRQKLAELDEGLTDLNEPIEEARRSLAAADTELGEINTLISGREALLARLGSEFESLAASADANLSAIATVHLTQQTLLAVLKVNNAKRDLLKAERAARSTAAYELQGQIDRRKLDAPKRRGQLTDVLRVVGERLERARKAVTDWEQARESLSERLADVNERIARLHAAGVTIP